MGNSILLEKVLNNLLNQNKNYVQTGFDDLDMLLSGLESGSLITIGGRPSMGKTTLMMSILENVLKRGNRCLYFSLEMNKEKFLQRLITQYAEFNNLMIKIGDISNEEKNQLKKSVEDFKNFDFEINDDWVTIDEIEENIKIHNPDYVFIDYLQLLKNSTKKDSQNEIKNLLKRLKNIAKELGCHVFISSQLSRAIEQRFDKRPILSDLRDSGAIEELSDAVIFIYRVGYYSSEDTLLDKDIAELIVAKNKFGSEGTIHLKFDSTIPKFHSLRNIK